MQNEDLTGDPGDETPPATPAAVAHAQALGVDLNQIEPAGDKIVKAEVEAAANAAPSKFYYCVEEGHPGVPNFQSQPLDVGRIFSSDEDVPTCPGCERQTNAIPCEGPDIPPDYIINLQERFGR